MRRQTFVLPSSTITFWFIFLSFWIQNVVAWKPISRDANLVSRHRTSSPFFLIGRGGATTPAPGYSATSTNKPITTSAGSNASSLSSSISSSNLHNPPSNKPLSDHQSTSAPNEPLANTGTQSTASDESGSSMDSTLAEPHDEETDPPPSKPEDPRVMFLIRILFLSYYSSLGALMPYLPVYYHSLGHGGQIIGMLGAVKPLTTFIVAPFWGLIADQSDSPFRVLKITFLVSLVGQLLVAGRHDFRYIMFMVFLTALFNAPVKSLIDSMVLDRINDRSQYGRLRLWGQMGFGIGSSGVGVLLSHSKGVTSSTATSIPPSMVNFIAKLPMVIQKFVTMADKFWQCITGYRLLFLTHAALSIPTWIAICSFQQLDKESKEASEMKIKKHKKEKSDNKGGARISEGLNLLIHNADALLFFFLVFVVGISSGIVENFAYVRIREVGGTGRDMGLSRLVSSIAGAPMFWFSGPLTEALGADKVLVLSLLSYVVRFVIYALMRHPLHGLPAEALRGITFAAFWSTGTIYAHRISPDGLHATMLMFLNAMYGGLGQSLGAIIGGKMQSKFGTVMTFVYSAAMDLCFVGLVIFYLSIRKDSSFRNPSPIARR